MVMESEGVDGIESGGTGANTVAKRVGDGEGDGGGGDSADALGPVELAVVEVGLFGASGGEDDGIPRGNPRWISHRQPHMVP